MVFQSAIIYYLFHVSFHEKKREENARRYSYFDKDPITVVIVIVVIVVVVVVVEDENEKFNISSFILNIRGETKRKITVLHNNLYDR